MKRILLFLVCSYTLGSYAQDTLSTFERQALQNYEMLKPGKSKFMIRGYYHTGFEQVTIEDQTQSVFDFGSLNPILMFKQSDRLFFEAEFDASFTPNGEFEFEAEYANMSYVLNDYVTARAGMFILPFGTFMEKLHPAWINRTATRPLGFGHDGIAPTNDVGVELRGAFHTGSVKLNYQLYAVNGPQLKLGDDEPEEAGMLKFGYAPDNNNDKAIGGRVGIFPFVNSMLEVGFSGMTAAVGERNTEYENVRANLYALDLSFVRNVDFLKSMIDIKAQYNYSQVDDAAYKVSGDTTDLFYDFNNTSSGYYAQLSIRPSMLENNFLRKTELVGRYSALQTPEGSLWEQAPTQLTFGLNYWIDWRTVLKFGFQTTDGVGGHSGSDEGEDSENGGTTANMFYIHWAMGF